jgi:hypothetical protein
MPARLVRGVTPSHPVSEPNAQRRRDVTVTAGAGAFFAPATRCAAVALAWGAGQSARSLSSIEIEPDATSAASLNFRGNGGLLVSGRDIETPLIAWCFRRPVSEGLECGN